jgi:hypothetical protein
MGIVVGSALLSAETLVERRVTFCEVGEFSASHNARSFDCSKILLDTT